MTHTSGRGGYYYDYSDDEIHGKYGFDYLQSMSSADFDALISKANNGTEAKFTDGNSYTFNLVSTGDAYTIEFKY